MKPNAPRPKLGVLIRFRNSAGTLPDVLRSLQAQTVQPGLIVAVDNGSTDHGADLLRATGATVVQWTERYSHPRVLNFGFQHCDADYVLVLSSHTTLEQPDVIERLMHELEEDPQVCGVSSPWDDDTFYSGRVTWDELKQKGLKFGGIYSNSMGMVRRECWERTPFDNELITAEDYGWAIAMLKQGYAVRRPRFPFRYLRQGNDRTGEFANVTFQLARQHGLKAVWLGPRGTLKLLAHEAWRWLSQPRQRTATTQNLAGHWARLRAWQAAL